MQKCRRDGYEPDSRWLWQLDVEDAVRGHALERNADLRRQLLEEELTWEDLVEIPLSEELPHSPEKLRKLAVTELKRCI